MKRVLDQDAALAGRLFAPADWSEMAHRLLTYTERRLSWCGRYRDCLSAVSSDFVQETIERYLEGRRQFNGSTEPELYAFLCGVIDSLVNHDLQAAMRRGIPLSVSLEESDADTTRLHPTYEIEREIHARAGSEHFLALLPPDLRAYVRLRLSEDGSTAEEYANELHVTTNTVRNLDRRLQRRRRMFDSCL